MEVLMREPVDTGVRPRRETREEIIARVTREQADLHPVPVYGSEAKRRVRRYLYAIWPVGVLVGALLMPVMGWTWYEGVGFGIALAVMFWYLGIVMLTERDDGRIQRGVSRLRQSEGD
jgi:hypothetical protein